MNISRHTLWRVLIGLISLLGIYLAGRLSYANYIFTNSQKMLESGTASESYILQKKAIKLNPLSAKYRRQYALINLSIATALAENANPTDETKTEAAQLVQQAIREAQIATQLGPNNDQNWVVLGQIYQNLIGVVNNVEQPAVDAYRHAIEIDGDSLNALYGLAQVFYKTQQYGEAAEMFKEVIKYRPGMVNAHYYLAKSFVADNRIEAATNAYEQVLQILEPGSDEFLKIDQELKDLQNNQLSI